MSTQYNRTRAIGSLEYTRQQLISLMFPYGYPNDTASAAFISAISTGTTATLSGDIALQRGINPALLSTYQHIFQLRYLPPTAGTLNKHVLIWGHGHDGNLNSTVYQTTSGVNNVNTGPNHSQRMQFYGLPNSPAVPTYCTTPLLNGIGMIEVSMLGQYLNTFLSSGNFATVGPFPSHNSIVSDLGAEMVGMFLWQFIVAINSVLAAGMIPVLGGFSGGGWGTLLTTAIDTRVPLSFVHSGYDGIFPSASTVGTSATGDGEQTQSDIYTVANAHELAVMCCDKSRTSYHIWNTSGNDGVFDLTTANIAGLRQGGLPALASQYGGRLEFVGFAGTSDPTTNFGTGSNAVWAQPTADVCATSALNSSQAVFDASTFTYSGIGHHLMHQAIHLMTTQILNSKT